MLSFRFPVSGKTMFLVLIKEPSSFFAVLAGERNATRLMENLETDILILHEGHEAEYGDDEEGIVMDEDHPMWRSERITLNSVGIDIGSSTSHLIFSRLTLRRQGMALSSRFVVVNREMLHESPILLTPYVDKTTIDTDKLNEFIHASYRKANLTPSDIDTGAIIVTGEAAKKKNAEAIAALFSAEAGKFVCATAGHNLESILAAYGSGAVGMTHHEGGDFTVMNVDIGGGTSKIAIAQGGKVIDTCAMEVGARLIAMDETGRINRLEDTALKVANMAGVKLALGATVSEEDKEKFAQVLCDSLFEVLERGAISRAGGRSAVDAEYRVQRSDSRGDVFRRSLRVCLWLRKAESRGPGCPSRPACPGARQSAGRR